MSLADHFAECPDCGGYIIEGTLRTGRTLSSMCRCPDEERVQAQVERELKVTIDMQKPRRAA